VIVVDDHLLLAILVGRASAGVRAGATFRQ